MVGEEGCKCGTGSPPCHFEQLFLGKLISLHLHFLNCKKRVITHAPLTGLLSGLNRVVCVKGLATITRGFLPSFLEGLL